MLERDVAVGFHRIEDANVDCYLAEDEDGLTIAGGVPLARHPRQDAHERPRGRCALANPRSLPRVLAGVA